MCKTAIAHVMSSTVAEHREGWRAGVRVGIGLAAGAFALAISFGAFSVTHGWPAGLTVLMSLVVFSGSAQFALVTAFTGGGLLPAVGSAALINLRFVPMAAATAPSLSGPRWLRAVQGQAVVDGSWVAARRPDGSFDRRALIAATLVQWPAWVAGTAIGAFAVPSTSFIAATGLDLVFPGFFLVLLLESLLGAARLVPAALLGAAVAGVAARFLPTGVALLLAAGAALYGLTPAGRARPADTGTSQERP